MVAAFLKLGMPTMMSALPIRAIWSRMAGVRAGSGTGPPYHRGAAVAGPCLARRSLAVGHRRGAPFGVRLAWAVARVGGLVGDPGEALHAPRPEPRIDRRPHVQARADEVSGGQDRVEQALALEERDVQQRLPVEPEQV